ncbi:MAG: lipopolysaccharide assembly protein LapA domain-containing protein [Tepidimonas ignava]|uniref:Lipopolysaccharide assembly protein A n=1 Tax=Tepidimonas ignava TaxID=114249 RepID=A0A4R3L6N9_9BURK|nr:lipopolysaccharide assembly protein LapA domain-containing protein [Tepidimonas ignava]MCX7814947.1 lipopolysaccharide assembly protein LapA domain-containing protein [Tepidimonas ignava]TCS95413.1 putative integral membrane protein [Tepidimonas ignava]TSE20026.1 Lipopolysaccharide assembly protein A [Tepidimonas ignava]
MKLLGWLLRAAFFLLVFALALNNQAPVVVHGLFGTRWEGPLALVLLIVLLLGVVLGVLVMAPLWWRARRQARQSATAPAAPAAAASAAAPPRPQPDLPDAV